ncbi:MAG: methyl-accepting chemotaxis protein [Nitrospirae bacterium]|nr:methyl-accepting chemotaxis protein [Nitrospirota bacterium]
MGLNVELLEKTFKMVAPKGDAIVSRFYEKLFQDYPAVKPMFSGASMAQQKKKLLASLVLVIQSLRKPDQLTKALHQLGAKHEGYGAKPAHYDAVAITLLSVLKEFAGAAWTPQVRQAWADALGAVKSIMLEGAKQAKVITNNKSFKGGVTQMAKRTQAKSSGKKKRTSSNHETFYRAALDNASANVLMCDRDLVLTYANNTAVRKLTELESEIRQALPGFSVANVIGSSIDAYHKMPERQRRILSDPNNMPHKADIKIGPLTLNLLVNAIMSEKGEYIGNIVEWEDVTEKRKMEVEMARLKTSLDNTRTNVLVCDRNYTLVYANNASVTALTKLESEIRKVLPHFSVANVIGANMDSFHKNPSHQRRLLDDPKNLPYRSEIKVGILTLDLNASAIMSSTGEYLGNIVEWMDITDQKKAQGEVEKLITAAASGQLNERVNADQFEGFFKVLSTGINKMMDSMVTPLNEAQKVLEALADGDLTREMTGTYAGDFNKIKESLNTAVTNLTSTLTMVRDTAENISSGAVQISDGNDNLSQRTSEQAGALEETSSSMEEMTATVKQNADNAKQANQLGLAARDIADKGGKVTAQAVTAMGEVNKSSKKIADIITVIDEIAFQTNLLALNAAVEAARAGEHGRGFAVVASEVRNLAQRSATAAKEIKALINESVQKVSEGSELVNQSGKTLQEIVDSVKKVTDIMGEISASSQEQATGVEQVNKAIMQMDEMTQQNASLVEEAASASQSMKSQSEELMKQVEQFKFKEKAGSTTRSHHEPPTPASMKRSQMPVTRGTVHSKPSPSPQKGTPGTPPLRRPAAATAAAGIRKEGNVNGQNGHHQEEGFEEF